MATVGPLRLALVSNQRCRTCMCLKSNQSPLFRRNLSLKVMKLADIKLREDDGLPTTICLDCEIDIERCYGFIAKIQNSDKKLRETLRIPHEIKAPEAINQYEIKQECIHIDSVMDQESCNSNDNHDEHYFESHVQVVEDRLRVENNELAEVCDGQEEPLIEDQQRHCNEPILDPLHYVKVEAETMSFEPTHIPETPISGPSTQSSAVRGKVSEVSIPVQPRTITPSQQGNCTTNAPSARDHLVSTLTSGINREFSAKIDFIQPLHFLGSQYNVQQIKNCSVKETRKTQDPTNLHTQNKCHLKFNPTLGLSPSDKMITKQNGSIHETKPSHTRKELHLKRPDITNDKSVGTFKKKKILKADVFKTADDKQTFCVACNSEFGSVELMIYHKEGKRFICRVCTNEFTNHDNLEKHLVSHKFYECSVCNKLFFVMRDLFHHRRASEVCGVKIECEICSKLFWNKESLRQHKIKFHSTIETEDSCKCVVCGKDLGHPQRLIGHLKSNHVVYEYSECRYCQQHFLGLAKLKWHIKTVHVDLTNENPLNCSTCGKSFKSRNILLSHEKIHDKTPMLCDICGKSVKGRTAMYSHVRDCHTKPLTCDCCKKTFERRSLLNRHLLKIKKEKDPSLIKLYYCEVCGKEFKSLNVLKHHRGIHSDERPFKCDECGATFKQSTALTLHRRTHNSEDKYRCDNCGNTYRWKQTFDKHVKQCQFNK